MSYSYTYLGCTRKRFRANVGGLGMSSLEKRPPLTEQEIEQMLADLMREIDEVCQEIYQETSDPKAVLAFLEQVLERVQRWREKHKDQAGTA
jgi:glutamate dehydrogenase/leucine dehydrogenase